MNRSLTDWGLLWLRIFVGLGMAYHGYGKIFGGYQHMLADGLTSMGFPAPTLFAWLASLSEFAGGILLMLGLFTRPVAFFIAFTMAIAAFMAHANDPLEKKEMALAYLVTSVALMLTGAGKFSIDQRCTKTFNS